MHAPRKLIVIGGALAAFTLLTVSARAEVTEWDHNGSLMRLEEKDKKVRLVYAQPREGLDTAGVKQGTVLFDGEIKTDGRFAGYAKLFRKGCDPVDYFVEGSRDRNKGEILLQGQAPVYAGQGCKITGYTDEGSASSLKFSSQGPAGGLYAEDTPQDRPGYLPPSSISGDEPDDTETANVEPLPRNPAASQPRARPAPRIEADSSERDYADRRGGYRAEEGYEADYYRPYGRDYRNYEEEYDAEYEEDYDDEPAYIPYQPGWRRY